MLIRFLNNEVNIGISVCYRFMELILPKYYIKTQPYGFDTYFGWLGGSVVWSRINKTHKDIRRVQEDRPLDSGSNDLRFPTHRTRSFRDGQNNASDGHWRTHGHN